MNQLISKSRLASDSRGFTLLEMIVVAGLLAMMTVLLYGTVGGILRGQELVSAGRSSYRSARYVLDRMGRELSSKVLESLTLKDEDEQSTRRRRRSYLIGKNKNSGKADTDSVRFVSDGAAQKLFGPGGNKGRVEIEYRLERNREESLADVPDDGLRNLVLVREEAPAGVDKEIAEEHRVVFPLAYNVVSLDFKYRRQGEWKEEWKDTDRGFPEAIQISLRLRGKDSRLRTFVTAVALQKERGGRTSPYEEFMRRN